MEDKSKYSKNKKENLRHYNNSNKSLKNHYNFARKSIDNKYQKERLNFDFEKLDFFDYDTKTARDKSSIIFSKNKDNENMNNISLKNNNFEVDIINNIDPRLFKNIISPKNTYNKQNNKNKISKETTTHEKQYSFKNSSCNTKLHDKKKNLSYNESREKNYFHSSIKINEKKVKTNQYKSNKIKENCQFNLSKKSKKYPIKNIDNSYSNNKSLKFIGNLKNSNQELELYKNKICYNEETETFKNRMSYNEDNLKCIKNKILQNSVNEMEENERNKNENYKFFQSELYLDLKLKNKQTNKTTSDIYFKMGESCFDKKNKIIISTKKEIKKNSNPKEINKSHLKYNNIENDNKITNLEVNSYKYNYLKKRNSMIKNNEEKIDSIRKNKKETKKYNENETDDVLVNKINSFPSSIFTIGNEQYKYKADKILTNDIFENNDHSFQYDFLIDDNVLQNDETLRYNFKNYNDKFNYFGLIKNKKSENPKMIIKNISKNKTENKDNLLEIINEDLNLSKNNSNSKLFLDTINSEYKTIEIKKQINSENNISKIKIKEPNVYTLLQNYINEKDANSYKDFDLNKNIQNNIGIEEKIEINNKENLDYELNSKTKLFSNNQFIENITNKNVENKEKRKINENIPKELRIKNEKGKKDKKIEISDDEISLTEDEKIKITSIPIFKSKKITSFNINTFSSVQLKEKEVNYNKKIKNASNLSNIPKGLIKSLIIKSNKTKKLITEFLELNDLINFSLTDKEIFKEVKENVDYSIYKTITEKTGNLQRLKIWKSIYDFSDLNKNQNLKNLYINFLKIESQYKIDIEKDINRTFPEDLTFRKGQKNNIKLKNILCAYSNYNKKIGYAQGLNFIVASVILIFPEEDEAFLFIDSFINKFNLNKIMGLNNSEVRIHLDWIQIYLERYVPKICVFLSRNGLSHEFFSTNWIITIFANVINQNTLFKFWDFFMIYGWNFFNFFLISVLVTFEKKILELDPNLLSIMIKKLMKSSEFDSKFNSIILKAFEFMRHEKKINLYENQN